jgi:hypothetical protein
MNKLNEAAEHFYNEMLLKKPFVDKEIATFLFKEVMESNAAKEYWYAQPQSSHDADNLSIDEVKDCQKSDMLLILNVQVIFIMMT